MTSDNKTIVEQGVTIDHEIQWVETIVRLNEIRPFDRNPRNITESQYSKLLQSIMEDGYHSRMKVTKDMRLLGGHQRLRALQQLGYTELPVLVADTMLSDDQYVRIMLRDNHNNGTWDMDVLGNDYELEFLRDIGLHEVMNIAPMPEEDGEPSQTTGKRVRCPQCCHEFPVKGNAAEES